MMSGHDANPISFNKKIKYWTSRTLANRRRPVSLTTSHFCLTLPPQPQNGRHMCITPIRKQSQNVTSL